LIHHAALYNTDGQYKEKDTWFSGSVGMEILWGFLQVFLCRWDEYGD